MVRRTDGRTHPLIESWLTTKKMGVMTNHGIEFTKKIGVSDFIEERKKKDGSYDEPWNRIY